MRHFWLVVACLCLAASACGNGGDGDSAGSTSTPMASTSTSASTTTSALPVEVEWSETVLERKGATGLWPVVLAGADGFPVVVFQHEVEPGKNVVKVARCVDVTCSDFEINELTGPEEIGPTSAALHADGSPLVAVGSPLNTDDDLVVLICADPDCSTVSEQRMSGVNATGLAVGSEGFPILAFSTAGSTMNEAVLQFGFCEDRECTSHRRVELTTIEGGFGRMHVEVLPSGAPLLFYETAEPPFFGGQGNVVVCVDPTCSDSFVPETIEMTTEPASVGLPVFAYLSPSQAIRVMACLDDDCSQVSDVEALRQFAGRQIQGPSAVGLADGSVFMAALAAPLGAGEGEPGAALVFDVEAIRCTDSTCEEVSVSEGGLAEANAVSVAALPDGGFALATSMTEPLCDLFTGECVDPESDDLGELRLTLCRGGGCGTAATPKTPEQSGVDVADAPLGGDIVFTRDGEVIVIEDGSLDPINLTQTFESYEGGSAWSRDGSRIAFHTDRNDPSRGENFDIYVMDADGSNPTQITDNPAREVFPDWSPDGTSLVFARESAQTGNRYLVIVDLETGTEVEVTDESQNSDFPAFSPDGTRIAFSRREKGSCEPGEACNFSIHVVDRDGTDETQITDVDGIDNNPEWSPDGTRIAFFSTREDPIERINWDIYVMNPDGSNTSFVTDHAGIDQFPAWSPDGTRILFQSDRSGISQLYTTTLDGSQTTLIAGTEGAWGTTGWVTTTSP